MTAGPYAAGVTTTPHAHAHPHAHTDQDRLIYGCMGLGGSWDSAPYKAADIDAAEAAVQAALDSGITAFDHADIYRDGKAEAVFGEVLARTPGLRERITVQTKCGIRLADGDRPGVYDLSGARIVRCVEESLTRLRTDHVDVLLLHRPDPLADPGEVAKALTSLQEQGLVRSFGVSNMSAHQIAHLQSHLDFPLVANQLEMSLKSRDWVEAGVLVNTPEAATNGFPLGTLEHCATHGIRLQAWGPLAQGSYTGREATPPNTPRPSWSRPWPRRSTPPRRRSSCGGSSATRPASPRSSARPTPPASEPAATPPAATPNSPTRSGTSCG